MMSYSEQTDSDHEAASSHNEVNDYGEETESNKSLPISKNKRKNKKIELKLVKKPKIEKATTYQDKIRSVISSTKFDDENIANSMTVKQQDKFYTIKIPPTVAGEEYWVLQHYKTDTIADVSPQDRWKHAECNIKLTTSDKKNNKDMVINKKFHSVIESVLERFMSDPKSKMTKNRNKT